jgi:glucose uptake protein GlcU
VARRGGVCRSNFVVVKGYKTGNGMFFQFMLCCGILLAGLIEYLSLGAPKFEPLALLGGFLWATGNLCVVPIIKCIGLGAGILIWGGTNLIMGWASGRFGLWGLTPQPVPHETLNYLGIVFAFLAMGVAAFVQPTLDAKPADSAKAGADAAAAAPFTINSTDPAGAAAGHYDEPLLDATAAAGAKAARGGASGADDEAEERFFFEDWPDHYKRAVGVGLSVFSGVLYGNNFNPSQYIIDHRDEPRWKSAPALGADYVFPQFLGIWLTSLGYFVLYALATRNKPAIYPQVMLPALLSGLTWAVAQMSWFYANSNLSFVITFPLISIGPGVVGSLWGIFVFKEIQGLRNFIFIGANYALTAVAAVLIVLSKS